MDINYKTKRYHPEKLILQNFTCYTLTCFENCKGGEWDTEWNPRCKRCSTRKRRTGSYTTVKSTRGRAIGIDREKDLERRFLESLSPGELKKDGSQCILFTGHTQGKENKKYGRIFIGKKGILAHRYAWELWIGPIPEGYDLDHDPSCLKTCVNPEHLTPRTKSEHVKITASRGEWPEDLHERGWKTRRSLYGANGRRGGD